MEVLTDAYNLSNLREIARVVPVPKIDGTIPTQYGPAVDEDLDEFESSPIRSGEFKGLTFNLKKDRIRLAVSDEAQYRSDAGDPLALQKSAEADALAQALDKKIALALQTSPQTSGAVAKWDTVTNNPLKDLAIAFGKVRPYRADTVVMTSDVWAAFASNDYTSRFVTGNPEKLGGVLTVIPGLNLKVYVNDDITAKSAIIAASGAPAVALGNGPIKIRDKDLENGGTMYQVDVWRQAKGPVFVNAAGKNKAAYQLTAVIA